jgi:hypothetical protein
MKKILKEIGEEWEKIPNSVKFWNSLVLLLLISVGLYSINTLVILWVIGSLLTIATIIENIHTDKHLWVFLMPITWFFILIGLFIMACMFIYERTISRFNNWLDSKGEDSESNFEEYL